MVGGCGGFSFEGWLGQPIRIATVDDVPVVKVATANGTQRTAVIATGSPLTVLSAEDGPSLESTDLRLYDSAATPVTRFVFHDIEVFRLPLKPVGLELPTTVGAAIGVNILRHFAVLLRWHPAPVLTLRDRNPDSAEQIATDCAVKQLLEPGGFARQRCLALFATPLYGGGQIAWRQNVRPLLPSRVVLNLCVGADPFDPAAPGIVPPEVSGVPLVGVLSTEVGTSVIARSAFERLRARSLALQGEEGHTLHLLDGSIPASLVAIPLVSVVSNETSDLGPCEELARRRRLLVSTRQGIAARDMGQNGAAVALVQTPVRFAVIDDTTPTIQGVRQEVRPMVPDVDVLLGGSFLQYFESEIDYLAQRTVLQCTEQSAGSDCATLPFCSPDSGIPCP